MGLKVSSEFAKLITTVGEAKIMEVVHGWEHRCNYQRNRYHKVLKPRTINAKAKKKGKK